MKDLQIRKDIARGSGNRVADGASVLQEGNNAESDHAHVRKVTPMQTKAAELRERVSDPEYNTGHAPDIDAAREMRTTQRRRDKETRPL